MKLLEKCEGLTFDDIDNENEQHTILSEKMHWQLCRNGGWQVVAEPAECDGANKEVLLAFQTNEHCLIYLIAQTEQPPLLNIQMVQKEDEDEDE